jgi:hypothetical protein
MRTIVGLEPTVLSKETSPRMNFRTHSIVNEQARVDVASMMSKLSELMVLFSVITYAS